MQPRATPAVWRQQARQRPVSPAPAPLPTRLLNAHGCFSCSLFWRCDVGVYLQPIAPRWLQISRAVTELAVDQGKKRVSLRICKSGALFVFPWCWSGREQTKPKYMYDMCVCTSSHESMPLASLSRVQGVTRSGRGSTKKKAKKLSSLEITLHLHA